MGSPEEHAREDTERRLKALEDGAKSVTETLAGLPAAIVAALKGGDTPPPPTDDEHEPEIE